MKAEVISIGTELLLGEIVDTNAAYIARSLKNIGIDLFFKTTVGDNVARVQKAIEIALDRADVVITTGGLGPTVDDVTRLAVAKATDRELEFLQPLLDQISSRFERWGTEMSQNNRQQAYVPAGAFPLENPVGTAPCFIVESDQGMVISLPGVPREMIHILENQVLPYLRKTMDAPAVIITRILRTSGIGESLIDSAIGDLELLTNPTVGLAAHAGQTDIRITAKASSADMANMLIDPLEIEIRNRLGINIYGKDNEQIEDVLVKLVAAQHLTMALAEAGTDGETSLRMNAIQKPDVVLGMIDGTDWDDLAFKLGIDGTKSRKMPLADRVKIASNLVRETTQADIGLSVIIEITDIGLDMAAACSTLTEIKTRSRSYAGPPENITTWASTTAFDLLRRWLIGKIQV